MIFGFTMKSSRAGECPDSFEKQRMLFLRKMRWETEKSMVQDGRASGFIGNSGMVGLLGVDKPWGL